MSEYAIRTDGLTIDFATIRAVDGLTMEIPAGSVFGFLGPNGAGKTTTIRLLLGLLAPTAGNANVMGVDVKTQPDMVRQNTGALLEHTGLYERMTAEQNLEFMGRIYCMSSAERQSRIKELLTQLDVWDRRKERVGTWSRGMKQKLAVARALFHRPALLFLDEPTAGFDPEAAAALREDLLTLTSQEGVTVFITTHNLAEAEKLCSQVGVIRKGKLIAMGRPDQLRASTGSAQVEVFGDNFSDGLLASLHDLNEVQSASVKEGCLTLQLNPDSRMAPLVRLMIEQGAEIEEIRKGSSSLEDAYLALMEDNQ